MGGLDRRVGRLEEDAGYGKRARQADAKRVLQEALTRISTPELEAMSEVMERSEREREREEWTEADEPLMRRLLSAMEEVRAEEAQAFPWLSETEERGGEK